MLAVTWFVDFFKIFKKLSESYAGRHVRADFHVNRSGDSLEIKAREKKQINRKTIIKRFILLVRNSTREKKLSVL